LVAAVLSLCGIGGLATPAGLLAILAGFVCFYLNRERGSKKDLIAGIGGMLLGFLIVATSLYFGDRSVFTMRERAEEQKKAEPEPKRDPVFESNPQ
jgi:uncharacterized membrane protein